MLDLDLLRTFQAVAEARGFTKAATALYRTQSTISLQIKKLEEAMKTKLIDRRGRRFALTDEGELLRVYARRILQLSREAETLFSRPTISGAIGLGVPEDFATQHLPLVLRRFAKAYPGVRIEVRCSVASRFLRELDDGELDLVLARREPGIDKGEPLCSESLVWVGNQEFELEPGEPLPLVLFSEGCFYRPIIISQLNNVGRPWRIAVSSSNLAGVHAAVLGGLGLTVLPESALLSSFGKLDQDEALPSIGRTEIAFFEGTRSRSDAVSTLLMFLRRSFAAQLKLEVAA